MKPVVTTNCKKSAEAIVPDWTRTGWEGLNLRRWQQMNDTEDGYKDRQSQNGSCLQMVSAEQREYARASAHQRISENKVL